MPLHTESKACSIHIVSCNLLRYMFYVWQLRLKKNMVMTFWVVHYSTIACAIALMGYKSHVINISIEICTLFWSWDHFQSNPFTWKIWVPVHTACMYHSEMYPIVQVYRRYRGQHLDLHTYLSAADMRCVSSTVRHTLKCSKVYYVCSIVHKWGHHINL